MVNLFIKDFKGTDADAIGELFNLRTRVEKCHRPSFVSQNGVKSMAHTHFICCVFFFLVLFRHVQAKMQKKKAKKLAEAGKGLSRLEVMNDPFLGLTTTVQNACMITVYFCVKKNTGEGRKKGTHLTLVDDGPWVPYGWSGNQFQFIHHRHKQKLKEFFVSGRAGASKRDFEPVFFSFFCGKYT